MTLSKKWLGLVLLASLCGSSALAQTATFGGVVSDPSDKVVADVQVTLTNEQTAASLKTQTNSAGVYNFPFVQPGQYKLAVEANGFKRYEQNRITIQVAQGRSVDVKLEFGNIQESVTVNGAGIAVNTVDGSVSTVIDRQFVDNIPLNGRSFQDLISLTPGVTTASPNNGGAIGTAGDFVVNGQRTESNGYIVDGVSANFSAGGGTGGGGSVGNAAGIVPVVTALGTTQALMSVDDLQEFRVQSSSYSAEYGRAAGGQFSFLTRSGTNEFHGSAYDYIRNNAFDANNWFNNYLGQPQPPLRQNNFGGTFGGPVWIPKVYRGRDKTFFFVSYEGLRLIQPQAASTQGVPDLNLRANAVAAMKPILNAMPLPNGPNFTTPCSGTTFSNATPTPCPAGAAPGTQVPTGMAQYTRSFSLPSNINATSVRLDQNFSSKINAFFRVSDTPSVVESRQRAYSNHTGFHSDTLTFTAGATNQFSSSINNSFRFGYGRSTMATSGYLDDFGGATPIDYNAAVGISGYPTPQPDFIANIPGTVIAAFFITNNFQQSKQWNVVDTASVNKGHHQLKFGFDYRRLTSILASYNPLVFPMFTNQWQIQNNVANSFEIDAYQPGQPKFNQFGLFAQDEWRVTSRLSLSLGLRWDLAPPPTAANGVEAFTLTGSIANPSTLAVAPRGTPLWHTSYFNFAPRLGAAYQLRNAPGHETVLRAGGGLFFDTSNWLGVVPYQGLGFLGSSVCPPLTCGFPATKAQIDAAAPLTTAPYTATNIYDYPDHMQLPYSLQWNVSVQQAFGAQQSLTVSYVGASSRRLPNLQYFNLQKLNPNFGTVVSAWGGIQSNYDSLQVQFQRKMSHGVQVLASYTWAHSLDNISEGVPLALSQRQFPPKYGNSDFDLRHNFVAAVSWSVPGVTSNTFANAILSHWGLDARFTARTAFPVAMLGSSGTDPETGRAFYSGVALNTNVPLYLYGDDCTNYYIAHGNPNRNRSCPGGRAINPAAYSNTASLDNPAPKGIARGFGENQINLSIRRDFPITERLKLQFRAESYNILNHPNFGGVASQVGAGNFGLGTSMLSSSLGSVSSLYQQGGPRSMQFSLRVAF